VVVFAWVKRVDGRLPSVFRTLGYFFASNVSYGTTSSETLMYCTNSFPSRYFHVLSAKSQIITPNVISLLSW